MKKEGKGKFGQVWTSLDEFGQVWASLGEFGRVWASLNEFGRHNISKIYQFHFPILLFQDKHKFCKYS